MLRDESGDVAWSERESAFIVYECRVGGLSTDGCEADVGSSASLTTTGRRRVSTTNGSLGRRGIVRVAWTVVSKGDVAVAEAASWSKEGPNMEALEVEVGPRGEGVLG